MAHINLVAVIFAKKVLKHTVLNVGFVALRPRQRLWSWRDGQFTQPYFFLGMIRRKGGE